MSECRAIYASDQDRERHYSLARLRFVLAQAQAHGDHEIAARAQKELEVWSAQN